MAKEQHISYKPSKEGAEKIERLREAVIALDDLIDDLLPNNSRDKALAKTHLEDSRMRAVIAIVMAYNDGGNDQGKLSGQE